MALEDDIRQASGKFYDALNQLLGGEPATMLALWSRDDDVSTLHPLGGHQVGWEEVRQGWETASQAIANAPVEFEPVEPADLHVLPLDERLAYTIGIERIRGTLSGEQIEYDQRATNIYRLENGGWKVVSHHVDTLPSDVLGRLMGGA